MLVAAVLVSTFTAIDQARAAPTFYVLNASSNSIDWTSAVNGLGQPINSNVDFDTAPFGALPLDFYAVSDGVVFSASGFTPTVSAGAGPGQGNTSGSIPGEGTHPSSNHIRMGGPDGTDVLIISFDQPVLGAGLFTIDYFGPTSTRMRLDAYDGIDGTGTLLGSGTSIVANLQPNNLYFMGVTDPANVIRSVVLSHMNTSGDVIGIDDIVFSTAPICFVIDAIDDEFSVINDGSTADFSPLANDDCRGDTPVSVVVEAGDLMPDRGGSATTDGVEVAYTPAAGFVGFEEFTYTAEDAGLEGGEDPPGVDRDTATVLVEVLEDLAPDAVDDVATTMQSQSVIIDVLANDSFGNGPTNEVTLETAPANGSATLQVDDSIRYSPSFGFFGEDGFEYRLTDANGDSDVATVTVGVFFVSGQVGIDIMPGKDGNNLNLRSGNRIPVAILSVGEFLDAPSLIDPLTLKFGPRQANIIGNPQVKDVDGDGDADLIVKFLVEQTGIPCGAAQATLSGRTFGSKTISGSDAVNTFNCLRAGKRTRGSRPSSP